MTSTIREVTRGTQPVAGGEIALMRGGAGPTLLIVHHEIGNPGWPAFADRLSDSRTVLLPDLPGYGASTRPEWARHPRDLAVMLELLLDRLGVDSLDLVGLGFGGWIAAEMATMAQRRLRSLVLVNPYGLQPRQGEILDQFVISHVQFVRDGFANEASFETVYGAEPTVDQLEQWDVHREMTTRIAWKPYMFNPSLEPLLRSVTVPALVLAGEEDRIVPPDCARRFHQALPNCRLQTLSGGHFLEMDNSADTVAAISTFIGKGA
jgi:pimeloyl-ACP methyl ester carboxylesterase